MTTRYAFDGVVETTLSQRATKADVDQFLGEFDRLRVNRPVVWIFDAVNTTGYTVDCVAAASRGFLDRRDRLRRIIAVTKSSIIRLAAVSLSVTTSAFGLPIEVCETLAEAHRRAEALPATTAK